MEQEKQRQNVNGHKNTYDNSQIAKLFSEKKRKTFVEYNKMSKKDIITYMRSYIANFDRVRKLYAEALLEINFLNRKVNLLEKKIKKMR